MSCCDMYRGHGNIHGMRRVRKQLQQKEQNIRQPSLIGLKSSTVTTAVIDPRYAVRTQLHCNLYELLVAFVVLGPDTYSY